MKSVARKFSALHIVANLVCFASDMKLACSLKIIVSLYSAPRAQHKQHKYTSIHLATRCVELCTSPKWNKLEVARAKARISAPAISRGDESNEAT